MGFTPNRLLRTDTYGDRQMAAIAISRVLRRAFSKASLEVTIPDNGHAFGVIDMERDGKVNEKIMGRARKELQGWGFDDPVVALPGVSNAESVHWSTPTDFLIKLRHDG